MDKQQAAEREYPLLCALHIRQERGKQQEAFKKGWEAHEAKSPSDAVPFAMWLEDHKYKKHASGMWCNKLVDDGKQVFFTLFELYKLFNPSGVNIIQ